MKTKAQIIEDLLKKEAITVEEAMTLLMRDDAPVIYYYPSYPVYPAAPLWPSWQSPVTISWNSATMPAGYNFAQTTIQN